MSAPRRSAAFHGLRVALAALALATLGAAPPSSPPRLDLKGWRVTLDERFTDRSDPGSPGAPGRWRTFFHMAPPDHMGSRTLPTNGEQQVYVDPKFRGLGLNPFRALPRGGVALIADRAPPADQAALEGKPYTSGLLTTWQTFTQRYGYFEAEVQIPRGKGLWPAVWLLPADGSWPPEIDIMEALGHDTTTYYATLHASGPTEHHQLKLPVDLAAAPHRYGVVWGPKEVVWYLDGRETARQANPPEMTKPMYLLLNLAVGGYWPGSPEASTRLPAEMKVFRVRAYAPPAGWRQ